MANYALYWNRDSTSDWEPGEPILHPGSNQFHLLSPGDQVWIVGQDANGLVLFGRVGVVRILSAREAQDLYPAEDLYPRDYFIEPSQDARVAKTRIPLQEVAQLLRFEGAQPQIEGEPSWQHFQRMRRLSPESAALLNALWTLVHAG